MIYGRIGPITGIETGDITQLESLRSDSKLMWFAVYALSGILATTVDGKARELAALTLAVSAMPDTVAEIRHVFSRLRMEEDSFWDNAQVVLDRRCERLGMATGSSSDFRQGQKPTFSQHRVVPA